MTSEIQTLADAANIDQHDDVMLRCDRLQDDSDSDISDCDVLTSPYHRADPQRIFDPVRDASRLTQASQLSTHSVATVRDVMVETSPTPEVRQRASGGSGNGRVFVVQQAWSSKGGRAARGAGGSDDRWMKSKPVSSHRVSLCNCGIFINRTDRVDCLDDVEL